MPRPYKTKKSSLLKSTNWIFNLVSEMRLELTRSNDHYPLKVARLPIPPSGQLWSEKRDSNPRPRPWQGRALPTELFSRILMYSCGPDGPWGEKRDSNPRPRPWQGRALPTELFSHRVLGLAIAKLATFRELTKYFGDYFWQNFITR